MCLYPLFIKGQKMPVPCGKCIECVISRSNEWAFRISNEASLYKENCFITLTYNEANLPQGGHLVKRDLQLFVKRLRKKLEPKHIRFFACGEYGSKGQRPHYHIIVFNYLPSDTSFFGYDKKHNKIFRSATIEKLWDKGFSSVGDVTFDSALYCAKYLQKLVKVDDKPKPFTLMSRKPAIGVISINSNNLLTDKIYANGKYIKLPRSYLNFIEKNGFDISKIKVKRKKNFLRDFGIYIDDAGKRIALSNSKEHIDFQYDIVLDNKAYEKYCENRRKKFFSKFQKIT